MQLPENRSINVSISTNTIINIVLIGLLIVALFMLSNLVLVILTSIVVASFVSSGSRRLAKYKINRTLAVIIIYLVSIGVLLGVFYLFIPLFLSELSTLLGLVTKYFPLSVDQTQTVSGASTAFSGWSGTEGSFVEFINRMRAFIAGASNGFVDTMAIIFGGMFNLVLIMVISFYLSIEDHGIENFLRMILPLRHEEYAIDLWRRTERKIALWMRGQLLLGLLVGVLIYLGLAIMGVKYALIMALVAAIFELIPFGLVLAVIPAVSFAYVDGGVTLALIVLAFYFIVHQFEVYLIQPLIVNKVVGISPLVVIVSVLIGMELAGFWGIILAVPVAVAILEFFDDVEKKKVLLRQNK